MSDTPTTSGIYSNYADMMQDWNVELTTSLTYFVYEEATATYLIYWY